VATSLTRVHKRIDALFEIQREITGLSAKEQGLTRTNVAVGSKANIPSCPAHVCFTLESRHSSARL
jgi:hypothetical protein